MKAAKSLGWVLFVLGIWEFAAPFVLGYAGTAVLIQDLVLGVGWMAFGLWIALTDQGEAVKLLGWMSALLGVWLILAPSLLGYLALAPAFWNDLLVGFLAIVLGMWAAFNAPVTPPAAMPETHH
jgi:hypothetical protein